MMSTLECFHHAARYEEKAEDVSGDADRAALLAQATRWRSLGDQAKAQDAAEVGDASHPARRRNHVQI